MTASNHPGFTFDNKNGDFLMVVMNQHLYSSLWLVLYSILEFSSHRKQGKMKIDVVRECNSAIVFRIFVSLIIVFVCGGKVLTSK